MRTLSLLTMALVPAALIAQAPAPAPAPAPAAAAAPAPAPAPALTFSQTLKAEKPAIDQLLKEFHPDQALAKAEALLPAAKPAFDGKDVRAASISSVQFSALSRIYHLAGKCAVSAGNWEKGRDYFVKAQETTQDSLTQTKAAYQPFMDSWKTAMAASSKALEDGAARLAELSAKTPLDANEEIEMKNFATHKQNLVNGGRQIKQLEGDINATQTELTFYNSVVEKANKSIADEKEELDKKAAEKAFKGSLDKLYVAMLCKENLDSRATKDAKLGYLYRLQFHCASSPQADKVKTVIDRVRGDEDPFPPEKKGKKKKQS